MARSGGGRALAPGRLILGGYVAAEAEVGDGEPANLVLDWPAEPFRAVIQPATGSAPGLAGPPALPAPEPSPAGPKRDSVADPCAPYARDPVQRLRCQWVTGPERDRFVLPAGRGAGLRTRMDCIPDRDDPERYAACVARSR